MDFQWDPEKARSNLSKHGVSFDEAKTIFYDPFSATVNDPDHSIGEHRLITVGLSMSRRVITVAHLEENGNIRIINARPASAPERRRYEESRHGR